jgi:hypothetical protein
MPTMHARNGHEEDQTSHELIVYKQSHFLPRAELRRAHVIKAPAKVRTRVYCAVCPHVYVAQLFLCFCSSALFCPLSCTNCSR